VKEEMKDERAASLFLFSEEKTGHSSVSEPFFGQTYLRHRASVEYYLTAFGAKEYKRGLL
jgi:hypothetical protein